jgi:hypothetical protein
MARQSSSVASRQQIGLPGHGTATTRGIDNTKMKKARTRRALQFEC